MEATQVELNEQLLAQQQKVTQSTLASTKQQMQQVKTIESTNPSGKVTKRVNNIHLMATESESNSSSTDHLSS